MKNENLELDSPLSLGNHQIRNRFFKSAMSEQLGDEEHNPKPGLATVYRKWVDGGVGISVTGNIMIDRRALGEPKNVVLDALSDFGAFRKWTGAATHEGAHLWAQLNHPGKQSPSFLSKEPVAPSAIPLGGAFEKTFNTPRELNEKEIWNIVDMFTTSARLAKKVGFTGVQIHGAHGYLVSQFLSPHHNRRTDKWGGPIENRMRFVLETYQAMRTAVGKDFPISIKLNSADFQRGGFTEEESMKVVIALADAGIDLIEISGGTYEAPVMMGNKVKESTKKREAYFLDYAEKVRNLVDVALVVTGGFRSAVGMTQAIQSGATDMVGGARPYTLFPDFPYRVMMSTSYRCNISLPSTGSKKLDYMIMINIVWFEQQIQLLSEGKTSQLNLSAWSTVRMTAKGLGLHALKKRRA